MKNVVSRVSYKYEFNLSNEKKNQETKKKIIVAIFVDHTQPIFRDDENPFRF